MSVNNTPSGGDQGRFGVGVGVGVGGLMRSFKILKMLFLHLIIIFKKLCYFYQLYLGIFLFFFL